MRGEKFFVWTNPLTWVLGIVTGASLFAGVFLRRVILLFKDVGKDFVKLLGRL